MEDMLTSNFLSPGPEVVLLLFVNSTVDEEGVGLHRLLAFSFSLG